MHVRGWILGVVLAVGGGASGQQPDAKVLVVPPTSVGVALRGLAARSGVVFVGQVQSIVPKEGVVEIAFLVEQPIVGVVGTTYVIREWSGRWTGGQQRYRVGQRAMFFLHAPSAAGLSSSVDGMAGVVPLIPMGANTDALLDVRMLVARVVRPVGSPMADAELGAIALIDAKTVVRNWRVEQQFEPAKRMLPAGVRPLPVKESPLVEQTDVPRMLRPREQSDVQR